MSDVIENVIFTKINDDFSYGRYSGIKVLILNENGYINISKLVVILNSKKKIGDWNALGQDRLDTIEAVKAVTGLRQSQLIMERTDKDYSGTYMHHLLVHYVCFWASKKFYVKIAMILNEYMNLENIKEKKKLLGSLEEKDDKIDKLTCMMQEMFKQTGIKIDGVQKELIKSKKEIKDYIGKLFEANTMKVVPTEDSDKMDLFVVLDKQNLSERLELEEGDESDSEPESDEELDVLVTRVRKMKKKLTARFRYLALRIQSGTFSVALQKWRKKYPNLKIFIKIEDMPNSKVFWNKVVETHGRKMVKYYSHFNLSNFDRSDFYDAVYDLHQERYE